MTPGFHDFPIQKLFATLAANYGTKDHIIQFASMIYVTVSMQPLTNGHSKQYVCTSCTCVQTAKIHVRPERQIIAATVAYRHTFIFQARWWARQSPSITRENVG